MKGKPLWALGCMSGTSLDGVDAAMVRTDGVRVLEIGPTAYRAYTQAERQTLRDVLGRWPGPGLGAASKVVQTAHAEIISGFEGYDIIGFHGQTLAHEPGGRGTHQLGDGAALAGVLGSPVVWDFRSADVGLGGEGAPLAPVYHWALAQSAGLGKNVCFLNLGGVGNITYVGRDAGPETLVAFDTGPANAPIDDLVATRTGQAYDADGRLAARGTLDQAVLDRFLDSPYFFRKPPKSLDRNDFAWLSDSVADLSTEDAVATLAAVAAAAVSAGVELLPMRPDEIIVCGGGRRNKTILQMIEDYSSCKIRAVEDIGFDGDMIEAQAFGYLAVRVLNGLPTSFPGTTGARSVVGGGVVSRPDPD